MSSNEYVRARVPREGAADLARTTSRSRAEAMGWEILPDERTHLLNGQVREDTRFDGRPLKPKTSVEKSAATRPDAPKSPPVGATPPSGQNDPQTPVKES